MVEIRKKLGKKGSILDILLVILIFFVSAVALIVALTVVNKTDDMGLFENGTQAQTALQQSQSSLLNMDNLLLFVLVGLSLFTVVSGFLLKSHPALFFISVFLMAILILLAAFSLFIYLDSSGMKLF